MVSLQSPLEAQQVAQQHAAAQAQMQALLAPGMGMEAKWKPSWGVSNMDGWFQGKSIYKWMMVSLYWGTPISGNPHIEA